jgi:WD40 repeat protein
MRLEGHLGPVSGARFFGYNIITISHDQTIRVWDIRKYPGSKKDYQAVAKITVDNVPLTSMGVTFDLSKLAINTEVNKV